MEGIGRGIAEMFNFLFITVGILLVLFLFTAGYTINDVFFRKHQIKTRTRIEPEIKLTTDGKIVDTLYIYREPKKN